uniref:Uncharacterized protein n=1 Tax=Anopheles merus TaxID=30066 RepID=A0A182UZ91_ANOME
MFFHGSLLQSLPPINGHNARYLKHLTRTQTEPTGMRPSSMQPRSEAHQFLNPEMTSQRLSAVKSPARFPLMRVEAQDFNYGALKLSIPEVCPFSLVYFHARLVNSFGALTVLQW